MVKQILFFLLLTSCQSTSKPSASNIEGTIYQNCPSENTVLNLLHSAEELAWSSLLGSKLAIRFMKRYLSCSGKEMKLSQQDFLILHPDIFYDKTADEHRAKAAVLLNKCIDFPTTDQWSGRWAAKSYGATLGNFYIDYIFDISCEIKDDNSFHINNKLHFSYEDVWDFNGSNHRPVGEESRVSFARKYLTGKSFKIYGEIDLEKNFSMSNGPNFVKTGPISKRHVEEPSEALRLLLYRTFEDLNYEKDAGQYSSFGEMINYFFGS
ncbi:MAG: hypothetical protein R3B45_10030 [Bdellovibrionota bacterium]